ncbi:MAG: DNA mismatch repair protein, partial [Candidatus Gracilibacteria bacterium]|nr:DNA mismatch repair protein [Candidatus Gracilibacteria bacterium]
PIVETIEENGLFIPNNVILGDKALSSLDTEVLYNKENDTLNGFLLYGINSAGKTVLSKSVGISIILAQAGMFVPATSLRLSLYDAIFTRISGSDNLVKGLSTFAIEMLELKNIFNRASSKSIVLGDEISHGTETVSGVSIVASTILFLNKLKCSFILATHLHQLDDIDEISELKTVSNVHLSILYDEHKDTLIYNRVLQAGSGSSVYGLEFAKSLKLPKEFIDKAYEIRKRFDSSELELLNKKKLSNYNSDVYMSSCAICGNKAIDTHHINEQNLADENGFIESFHKNHKYNLIPVCKKCHSDIHDGKIVIKGWEKTSEGLKLSYK